MTDYTTGEWTLESKTDGYGSGPGAVGAVGVLAGPSGERKRLEYVASRGVFYDRDSGDWLSQSVSDYIQQYIWAPAIVLTGSPVIRGVIGPSENPEDAIHGIPPIASGGGPTSGTIEGGADPTKPKDPWLEAATKGAVKGAIGKVGGIVGAGVAAAGIGLVSTILFPDAPSDSELSTPTRTKPWTGFIPVGGTPVAGSAPDATGVAEISWEDLIKMFPFLGHLGPISAGLHAGVNTWDSMPGWVKAMLATAGIAAGTAVVAVVTGNDSASDSTAAGKQITIGKRTYIIAKTWMVGTTPYFLSIDGWEGARRKNGVWRVWKPERGVSLSRRGKNKVRNLVAAAKVINKDTKDMKMVLDAAGYDVKKRTKTLAAARAMKKK